MKIIAFEGCDASGKQTQAEKLRVALDDLGFYVEAVSFPRYHTEVGKLIKKSLMSEIDLSDKALHMLLEVDKQDFMKDIERMEKDMVDFLICDRYTMSNLAFCMAKSINLGWVKGLQAKIRKPDLTLILDLPVEVSIARKRQGYAIEELDKHELNTILLHKARLAYKYLYHHMSDITGEDDLIYLVNANQTPEMVNFQIMDYVKLLIF